MMGCDRRLRLLLADDHPDVREEIRQFLESDFDVLRDLGEGRALVDAATELKPDFVICDIQMPRMSGIEAAERILRDGACTAIIALSMHRDPHLVRAALNAGIQAYVLKVDASDELVPAIHAALRGERYLSRGVRDACRD